MSDDEGSAPNTSGKSEAQLKMEAERQRRKEKAEEEWKEYEELRKEQREKEDQEIQELRERRERRKKEREEEEKRLTELRQVEEQKRRAEEEERQKKKREDDQKRREEREKKRAEFEARSKNTNTPNFVINKKADSGQKEEEVTKTKEEVTKSKEQLEAEKRAILEQRIPKLDISGFKADQLKAKAKELHELICRLEGDKYDLEQRFARQGYEMQELADRARQMNKGTGSKKTVQSTPDPLAAKISGIPPKIVMYSEYDRVTDHRDYTERKTVFSGALYSDEYQKIEPKAKVVMTETGFKVEEPSEGGANKSGENETEVAEE